MSYYGLKYDLLTLFSHFYPRAVNLNNFGSFYVFGKQF